jgi:2-oxoglutarate ferredoxin oxidoreductase subunit gamma
MEEKLRVIVGGAGGQGILTLGKVISYAAINRGFEVSCLPTYGAEMRGGYVFCILLITNSGKVFSPLSSVSDIGIFMDAKSFTMLRSYLKEKATVILNTSLIRNVKYKNLKVIEMPITEKAEEMGSIKIANMLIGGRFGNLLNRIFSDFTVEDIYAGIDKVIKKDGLIDLSKKAAKEGWDFNE